MLDQNTRRKIDSLRDTLVGKVPDPKAQVEQITIALIYKFMNDMDEMAIDLGGESTFFEGEYKKYAWSNIMTPSLSGFERVLFYAEGIEKMNTNPNIPQLFRDIFRGAFLPYRDPETLNLFLKGINEFSYEHSEDLGDAFEYLLSVLGSQGDAGQFRTPRHIIDMITEIVAPNKNDTILDPACGTAGFLISAYKHMLGKNSKERPGDLLTPEEKKKIVNNLVGYDISPDMVRLSRVNMYLHGFPDPKIDEYDTLTSEDKWNEDYDVILANPPFMSPKGGIKPHNKFSVKANRSEVLFVDYIAEHLSPGGRAGVIVPEGIIFQSANAYKGLRKFLIEKNFLYAVISLPAGVFQPYSGVKTSILMMDKTLAKKTDKILFVKVENDGYDLGAQRRETEKNDLPKVTEFLKRYKLSLMNGQDFELSDEENAYANIVDVSMIADVGDYNLSGDRYREKVKMINHSWEMIEIGEICNLINGRAFKPTDWEKEGDGGLPIIRIQNLNNKDAEFNYFSGEVDERYFVNHGDLLFSWSGSRGTSFGSHIWYGQKAVLNQHIFRVEHRELADKKYLHYALNKAVEEVEENLHGGVGLVHITKGNLEKIKIPLPPLSVQQEIVAELEGYQKIIDGAKQVVENYNPKIKIDPNWGMTELEKLCEVQSGGTPSKDVNEYWSNGTIPWYSSGELNCIYTTESKEMITDAGLKNSSAKILPKGSLLIGMYDTAAFKMSILDREASFNQAISGIKPNSHFEMEFLYLFFSQNREWYLNRRIGARQRNLTKGFICSLDVPLISIEEQIKIVEKVREEMLIIEQNKKLIQLFEQKIKDRITEVWC